jgi:hypothetical protein
MFTVTVAVWVNEPLVPVTVTVNVPALEPVQESVEFCDAPRTMLEGLSVHERPNGEAVAVRVTVPVNPFTGATVIVDEEVPPELAAILVGLADIEKSTVFTFTVVL